MSEQLYTRTEIENQFGICANSLRQLVNDGEFPAPIKIGRRLLRWRKSTVDAFIAAQDEQLNGHLVPTQQQEACN